MGRWSCRSRPPEAPPSIRRPRCRRHEGWRSPPRRSKPRGHRPGPRKPTTGAKRAQPGGDRMRWVPSVEQSALCAIALHATRPPAKQDEGERDFDCHRTAAVKSMDPTGVGWTLSDPPRPAPLRRYCRHFSRSPPRAARRASRPTILSMTGAEHGVGSPLIVIRHERLHADDRPHAAHSRLPVDARFPRLNETSISSPARNAPATRCRPHSPPTVTAGFPPPRCSAPRQEMADRPRRSCAP